MRGCEPPCGIWELNSRFSGLCKSVSQWPFQPSWLRSNKDGDGITRQHYLMGPLSYAQPNIDLKKKSHFCYWGLYFIVKARAHSSILSLFCLCSGPLGPTWDHCVVICKLAPGACTLAGPHSCSGLRASSCLCVTAMGKAS